MISSASSSSTTPRALSLLRGLNLAVRSAAESANVEELSQTWFNQVYKLFLEGWYLKKIETKTLLHLQCKGMTQQIFKKNVWQQTKCWTGVLLIIKPRGAQSQGHLSWIWITLAQQLEHIKLKQLSGTCWFYSTFLFYLDHFTKWDDWDAYNEQAEAYQTTEHSASRCSKRKFQLHGP